jgi:hypothetical protein
MSKSKKRLTPVERDLKTLSGLWETNKKLDAQENKLVKQRNALDKELNKLARTKDSVGRKAKPVMRRLMSKSKRL